MELQQWEELRYLRFTCFQTYLKVLQQYLSCLPQDIQVILWTEEAHDNTQESCNACKSNQPNQGIQS